MTYKLFFHKKALKEWKKLTSPIKEQFKKKLQKRLESPRVQSDKLHGIADRYKIKLRASGYRLVYEVLDKDVSVVVIVINHRERVYGLAEARKAN